jgi:hypothetical protein
MRGKCGFMWYWGVCGGVVWGSGCNGVVLVAGNLFTFVILCNGWREIRLWWFSSLIFDLFGTQIMFEM